MPLFWEMKQRAIRQTGIIFASYFLSFNFIHWVHMNALINMNEYVLMHVGLSTNALMIGNIWISTYEYLWVWISTRVYTYECPLLPNMMLIVVTGSSFRSSAYFWGATQLLIEFKRIWVKRQSCVKACGVNSLKKINWRIKRDMELDKEDRWVTIWYRSDDWWSNQR